MIRDDIPSNRPPVLPQWDISRLQPSEAPQRESHDPNNALSATLNSIVRLVIVIVLVGALLIPEVELNASLKLVIIALLLVLIGFTSAAPLLVVFQTLLFFRHSESAGWANTPASCLFVAVVMGLVMFLSRDRTLKWIVRQSVVDLWKIIFTRRRSTISTSTFPMSHDAPGSLVRVILLQVACVMIAQCLLWEFPLREADGQSVTYVTKLLASIRFPLIVLVAMVVIMSELAWRRITAQQASVYLRSSLMTLLYPDLRMVVRRRRKSRQPKPTEAAGSSQDLT